MNTVLTEDGKVSILQQVREDAQLEPGDTLDVQFYKGTLVLRKRQPLTSEQCAAFLERSRSQPKPTPQDDDAVEQAIKEVWMRPRCPDQCYLTESDKRALLQSPFFFDTSGKPIFTKNALLEKYAYDDGYFGRTSTNNPARWKEGRTDSTAVFYLDEIKRDTEVILLKDASRGFTIEVPIKGGPSRLSADDGRTWLRLYDVRRD